MAAVFAGLVYFGVVFTFAFVMGIVRTLLVAPNVGPTVAVWLELPVVLAVSWVAARRLLRHRSFTLPQRLIVGVTAFVATMVSEAAFAHVLRGQTVGQWAETLSSPLGLVGLAAQIGFAAMPALAGSRACGRAAALLEVCSSIR